MPKSKRNKTVDLSKTKKHGLEGKKELYKKIQSNVENYAHVFVFAVNDMRNSKMKNVREQWKHSRFCIGKNKVMAMALGRTPEEEYRPNLHKVGQMLVGERGLLFTNQSADEVTNWFQSYSEGDYARSGNVATEDVILPEGPLPQFPHSLESYLRQLGLPTTLKKGVIHLVKEHVVCTEGDRLSPETARILKLLGYEMAEFRIRILSVWSQDGSFVNLQTDCFDEEFKENVASSLKSFEEKQDQVEQNPEVNEAKSAMNENDIDIDETSQDDTNYFENTSDKSENLKDCNTTAQLEMEVEETQETEVKEPENDSILTKSVKNSRETVNKQADKTEEQIVINEQGVETEEQIVINKQGVETEEQIVINKQGVETEEQIVINKQGVETEEQIVINKQGIETEEQICIEEIQEPVMKKPKDDPITTKSRRLRKTVANQAAKTEEEIGSNKKVDEKEQVDTAAILKMTENKLQESAEKPKKFSPKMTRARAAAANKKIKTPEPLETKRASRKRKM